MEKNKNISAWIVCVIIAVLAVVALPFFAHWLGGRGEKTDDTWIDCDRSISLRIDVIERMVRSQNNEITALGYDVDRHEEFLNLAYGDIQSLIEGLKYLKEQPDVDRLGLLGREYPSPIVDEFEPIEDLPPADVLDPATQPVPTPPDNAPKEAE